MMVDLNLYNLVCGIGNQLRYVDRFSTCRRNHRENVAEHQFYTAFFTLIICKHLDQNVHPDVHVGRAVIRALIHDLEEHCTGDVVRPVKHGSELLMKGYEDAGAKFCSEFFGSLTESPVIAEGLFEDWVLAKDDTLEGRVVRFADFLSVLAYLNQEVRSGNTLVMDNINQLDRYVETFYHPEFEFLLPLVRQADAMVKNLIATKGSKQ